MSTSSSLCGFVYVATGDIYYGEAERSAATLRKHHPVARICLVTDKVRGTAFWDDLVVLENPVFGFRDKMTMLRCPYDQFVFLDTDTTVFGPLDELFDLLGRFDVCGVQLFEGQDYAMEGIPPSFPEMNSGVLGFRRNSAVERLFIAWERLYLGFRAENTGEYYHYANVGDQKSLRAALWETDVRIMAIGPEFNFIPFKMDFASLPVRVLHTRATENLSALEKRLNDRLGRRAYIPLLDVVVSNEPSPMEIRRMAFSALGQMIRRAGRRCIPFSLRNVLRRSRWLRRCFVSTKYLPEKDATAERKWEKGSPP